ncbi:MAG TPA: hypothetical protein VHH36_08370 [Candidatus Thermoplasmatota archaeon]|nr:hypothetical protein [Candidatus Thermoplasmatota archaeon]
MNIRSVALALAAALLSTTVPAGAESPLCPAEHRYYLAGFLAYDPVYGYATGGGVSMAMNGDCDGDGWLDEDRDREIGVQGVYFPASLYVKVLPNGTRVAPTFEAVDDHPALAPLVGLRIDVDLDGDSESNDPDDCVAWGWNAEKPAGCPVPPDHGGWHVSVFGYADTWTLDASLPTTGVLRAR